VDEFGSQDELRISSPQQYDPMFSFESAFPELDLRGQPVEKHTFSDHFCEIDLELPDANQTNATGDGQTFHGLFLPDAPNSQLPLGATFSAQDFMSHSPAIEARTQTGAGLETTFD
jgi:hypothetical protein